MCRTKWELIEELKLPTDTRTAESYVEKPKTLAALRDEIASGRTKAADLADELLRAHRAKD